MKDTVVGIPAVSMCTGNRLCQCQWPHGPCNTIEFTMNSYWLLSFDHMILLKTKVSQNIDLAEAEPTRVSLARLSPLHFFRKDYMRQHKGNPVSRESWADVKAAFAQLNEVQLARYNSLCTLEQERGRCMHQLKRLQGEPQPHQIVVIPSAGHVAAPHIEPEFSGVDDTSQPIFGDLLPADFDLLRRCSERVEDLQPAARKSALQCSTDSDIHWPLEESNVLAALVSASAKEGGMKAAGKEFKKRCQVIAGPDGAGKVFPSKVQIHGKCGSVCVLETSVLERNFA